MVARSVPGVRVSNDDLAEVAKAAPDRLLAVASVDPIELGVNDAVAEATRAVKQLGHKGINIDAGFYAEPLKANDERLMPLYEACQTLGVPAFVMSGPTTPNLEFNDPFAIDTVAKTFPSSKSSAATDSIRVSRTSSRLHSATRTSSSRRTCIPLLRTVSCTSRRQMAL